MHSSPIKDKQIFSHSFNTHHTLINLGVLLFCMLSLLVGFFISYSTVYAVVVMAALFGIVIILRPEIGLYLMVFAIPLETLSLLAESFTVIKLIGWMVLSGWMINVAFTKKRIVFPREAWYLLAFIAWGLLSAFWAIDAAIVVQKIPTILQLLGFYVLFINLVDSRERMQRVFWALLIGSVLATGITVLFFMGIYVGNIIDMRSGRIALGSFNAFPAALLLIIPFLFLSIILASSSWLRFVSLGAISIILMSFFLAMSRGAILGLIFIIGVMLIIYRRYLPRLILLMPICILIALYFMPEYFWHRMVVGFTLEDRGTGRMDIWLVGWNMIIDNPLLGVGLSSFSRAFNHYLAMTTNLKTILLRGYGSHSLYIGTVAELGIVGGVLLLVFVVSHLRNGYMAMRVFKGKEDRLCEIMSFSAFLSFFGLLVVGISSDILYRKSFWMSMALIEAISLMASNTSLAENKRIVTDSSLRDP